MHNLSTFNWGSIFCLTLSVRFHLGKTESLTVTQNVRMEFCFAMSIEQFHKRRERKIGEVYIWSKGVVTLQLLFTFRHFLFHILRILMNMLKSEVQNHVQTSCMAFIGPGILPGWPILIGLIPGWPEIYKIHTMILFIYATEK